MIIREGVTIEWRGSNSAVSKLAAATSPNRASRRCPRQIRADQWFGPIHINAAVDLTCMLLASRKLPA